MTAYIAELINWHYIVYEGTFKNNMKHGYGMEYDSREFLVYEGHFRSNNRNGYGVLYHENGKEKYKGNWYNGYYHIIKYSAPSMKRRKNKK